MLRGFVVALVVALMAGVALGQMKPAPAAPAGQQAPAAQKPAAAPPPAAGASPTAVAQAGAAEETPAKEKPAPETPEKTKEKPAAEATGEMYKTGADLVLWVLMGCALIASGLVMRRFATR